jgi:hypothetical protein
LLQDPRVNPSADNNSAIRLASQFGHIAVVDRLLQDPRVDPSADNNSAIYLASQFGHIAVDERLLQDKRITSNNLEYLTKRLEEETTNPEIVKLLKQHLSKPKWNRLNGWAEWICKLFTPRHPHQQQHPQQQPQHTPTL